MSLYGFSSQEVKRRIAKTIFSFPSQKFALEPECAMCIFYTWLMQMLLKKSIIN
jgi:hypothetical protein